VENAVSAEFRYDAASRLTARIYQHAAGWFGDLTYEYDASGNRVGAGGSFARALVPAGHAISGTDLAKVDYGAATGAALGAAAGAGLGRILAPLHRPTLLDRLLDAGLGGLGSGLGELAGRGKK
jgi:hypothetical protein